MIAIIYKLTDDNGLVYYGSTIRELSVRLYGHKGYSNNCSKFMNSETMVIESLEQYYFDEDTYNKKFVLQREAYYIKNNKCINKIVPDRTRKEYNKEYRLKKKEELNLKAKEYYETNKEQLALKAKEYKLKNKETIAVKSKEYKLKNKEKLAVKNKEYNLKNKETINEKSKEYYEKNKEKLNEKFDCECGGKYIRSHKSSHMKTKKHINYIEKTT